MRTQIRIPRPNPAAAQAAARDWNEKYPIGTLVEMTKDDGSLAETITSSEAWVLGCHIAVVKLAGISGGYALSRVHAVPQPITPPSYPRYIRAPSAPIR